MIKNRTSVIVGIEMVQHCGHNAGTCMQKIFLQCRYFTFRHLLGVFFIRCESLTE